MRVKRVMIAAPKSGSGKTTITCALLQILKDMRQQVISFKCGPDYIDPMFHQKVIGVPSKNLDTFFTGAEDTKSLFLMDRTENDVAVLEGVMGLFDGLGGIREEGSSYHLAKITKTPIILIVDAKGMGRSVVPLVAGFLQYDKEHLIKGVILNRMSKSYYDIIKPLMEEELNIQVLGYFPEHKELQMQSRHLGLIMPDELMNIKEQLQAVSEELKKTVLIDDIMFIAESAEELEEESKSKEKIILEEHNILKKDGTSGHETTENYDITEQHSTNESHNNSMKRTTLGEKITDDGPLIAVAKDEAFCFYYEDNLRLLRECGARMEYFSPLHDKELPAGCNAILIGGGYPELYAGELEANVTMRIRIKQAIEDGMPVVAECGGFMYLHSSLVDGSGKSYAMVGVIPEKCFDTGKLVRFGYIELQEMHSTFLAQGERIRGHEFHYYDSTYNGNDCQIIKPVTGRTYQGVMKGDSYWYGFPHLYYPSNPRFAKSFVKMAREYKKE